MSRAAGRELRLLIWKDYLIRKRKWVTLAGVVWATAVMMSLYIVRVNIDNKDYPTCQFPARALPSAGMLTFLQSFICSVNNECNPMEQYEEIPIYENSTLTHLQRKFSPFLNNDTVLEVAATVPDALKLLAKLSEVADEPSFVQISKNGLKVEDLFTNRVRVKRQLANRLNTSLDVTESLLTAKIRFQGLTKGLNRCSTSSVAGTFLIGNEEHLEILTEKLCQMTNQDLQSLLMELIGDINFQKYIRMMGNMYAKLSGDNRVAELADTVTAVLRMTNIASFLPTEIVGLFKGDVDFTYVELDLIPKLMDLFKPTFKDTKGYKSVREFADTFVTGIQYLDKLLVKRTNGSVEDEVTSLIGTIAERNLGIEGAGEMLDNVVHQLKEKIGKDDFTDIFNLLPHIANFVFKWIPDDNKHDVLFYSTLLTKLIEGATKVVDINMNIEERTYNASLRHPDAIKVLVGLPTAIIEKGFEALADAERIQVMSSRVNTPEKMFCDVPRLQVFFKISKDIANNMKSQLCTNAWQDYVADLIRTFGVYEVKDNINSMAALLIQETLGKDTSSQLYTIEYNFIVLRNFFKSLKNINNTNHKEINWSKIFNADENQDFMTTIQKKAYLGKQMLITIHGALTKEVVKQNPILSYKITPILLDATTLISGINDQLDTTDKELVAKAKQIYPSIVKTVLNTALDETKTYKSLSTRSEDILCNDVDNAKHFIDIPDNINQEDFVTTLCDISRVINDGLTQKSVFGKAIEAIRNTNHKTFDEVNWTKLISGLKDLYVKLNNDYPYIFQYTSYGMDENLKKNIHLMFKEAKEFWFGNESLGRSARLSMKLAFRILDLVDRDIFNVSDYTWVKMKYSLNAISKSLIVYGDIIKTVVAIYNNNENYMSPLPQSTVAALIEIIPNIPQMITDAADILKRDDTELEPIISLLNSEPYWPCSESISELLTMKPESNLAVQRLETLMCMDTKMTGEWLEYLEENDVSLYDIKKWNTTKLPRHVFLKFSSSFDALIDDSASLIEVIRNISKDERGDTKVSAMAAAKYATEILSGTEGNQVLKNFFTKMDIVLNSIETDVNGSMPLNILWSEYVKCNGRGVKDVCRRVGRAAWKYSLQFVSVMFKNVVSDVLEYFTEINEPNVTILQLLGFTKRTALYDIYNRLPEFIGVLLNSYWDYGFMSQVRRASLSKFWDCEAIVTSLVPPIDSSIDETAIQRIQPYLCPSFLYWLSLPKGDNALMDIVSKPNYYLYNENVKNLTSEFGTSFTTLIDLKSFLTEKGKNNQTALTEEDTKMNSIQGKLQTLIDKVVNYQVNASDPSYRQFGEITKKQFASNIYLTRIVEIVNKLMTRVENITVNDITESKDDEYLKKLKSDLTIIQNIFKRRPEDAVALHFDVITNMLWTVNGYFNLTNAMSKMCNDFKNNDTSKDILFENQRVKNQLCSKNYQIIYDEIEKDIDDYEKAKLTLLNLALILNNDDNLDSIKDISEFIGSRKQLVKTLQRTIKYSYDLSTPIFLQYLQSNVKHYDLVISFLTGEDWWGQLKTLYNGPQATKFIETAENSFAIAEDWLSHLDGFHIVKLLRDIDVNSTQAICNSNIVMADYIPDQTGIFTTLKGQLCDADEGDIFREIPPLLFASQGYDSSLRLSRDVNYTLIDQELSTTEFRLNLIKEGPVSPQRPFWVTDERLGHLKLVASGLLSKETIARVSFGVLNNLVDAGTLFLNTSQCTLCSQFTTWFKQLNLQIFKKQEYDALLCRLEEMTMNDVYHTLQNDFHWEMAIHELISTRNYTKFELNKSMNDFLEIVKLHLLEDLTANSTKLSDCLARNVSRNEFGNATLFISVLARTARLLRSATPHLHNIDGFKDMSYLKQLQTNISPNLKVFAPLKDFTKERNLMKDLRVIIKDDAVIGDLAKSEVNLKMVLMEKPILDLRLYHRKWEDICRDYNCTQILSTIYKNINKTHVEKELPTLQTEEFWRFNFISEILYHTEMLLSHMSRLLGVASRVDVMGVTEGKLHAMIDFLMEVLNDDILSAVLYSLQGLTEEIHPLLQGAPLETDLRALATGLEVLNQFKNYLLQKDLKIEVSEYFSNPDQIETGLTRLGINNTNFWSIAAHRVHAGFIDLKPIFTKQPEYHISNFVCQIDYMSKVILPTYLDVVTSDDVYGAIAEQFCGLDDERVKEIVPVLIGGLNFSTVLEKLKDILLPQLYASSNLTELQGATVMDNYPRMAALLPVIQENVGDLSDIVAKEPLIKDLSEAESLGGLLNAPSFLSHAGSMLCGKPFQNNENRFYKAIAQSPDFSGEPDQAQLDVLPTDFCRNMYKDIIKMDGGKILWSFVKPLIMGKILYTPSNPTVERIMEKANSSFAQMIKLTSIIHSLSNSFSSIDSLSDHRAGASALRQFLVNHELAEALGISGGLPEGDIEELLGGAGDMKGIGSLLKRGSDLLQCINLNRFRAIPDEYQLTHDAVKLSMVDEFSAGIVFLNTEEKNNAPRNVAYKIRMDIDNAPTTTRTQNYFWVPGPESSFIEHMRYFRGFIQIQDMVDKAIIQLSRSTRIQKRETNTDEMKWAVYTQQEPYPCYRKDFFQTSLYESQALIVSFFFSLLFTVASVVRFIVADKESGNTMLMSVMGVNLTNHTLSWFISSLVELAVTSSCVTAVLTLGGVLPRTEPSLLLAMLLVFSVAVVAFCYMMSKLFNSASFAAVVTAMAYLITFMPFVVVLSLEAVLSLTLKLVVCLFMSSAMCYAFLVISRYEAIGSGAGWADVWVSPPGGDMSIGVAMLMVIVDIFIYIAVGYLLDRFYGPKTLQSNITHCSTSGEKAGVSIVNISKSYGKGRRKKLALDGVSIELHQGQITTLLGHNGAGKTTLTKILTGMLKPTSGHVIIRSDNKHGTQLGVCPQKDVLFDYMTPSEHVALYAQLKSGRPLNEVQQDVDSILRVLSLGQFALEPAGQLSGGTRRRLCVALAFVGRPHLVSLDEPTAGVDPAARRDIWSLIVKLRQDRTVLMTTHHLDEAELLSDQIIIMHKGQVHTTGSPVDIKRSLGNGYKLSVTYPDKSDDWPDDEVSFEERSKSLMSVVRESVKNAAMVDVNGLEIEICLPFFDANGLNNNFLDLCVNLESRQAELGFRSYTMDCSSLEQVFMNICQHADDTPPPPPPREIEYDPETPSKSASTSSIKSDRSPLVPSDGPLRGSRWDQFCALLHARYLHYCRNRWLLFLLIVLPSLFVTTAMAFSMIRPPADNEISLRLTPELYENSTQYLIPKPSIYSRNISPLFAEQIMYNVGAGYGKNWTSVDTPQCKCTSTRQECDDTQMPSPPQMMALPNVSILNDWILASHENYIERRYGGFSSSLQNNITNLIAWYNNKGHHAMPSYLNALNNALLKTVSGDSSANIIVYSHPLKISKEQISKDTVYQHVADAGISGLVLVSYCLVAAGAAVYLVDTRARSERRLQWLAGAGGGVYWAAAAAGDMTIILINLVITVIIFELFGFPVFVARNNLPAICLLIVLFGFACGSFVHVLEKLFSEASLANMILFCGNAFIGLFGITILLILDIISDSDATDNVRWVLHKIFLLFPQFALGDGLLEIAKNTIQSQVLYRFGMDTYRDPFTTDLIAYHYLSLVVVGLCLFLLNLAIEYDCFEGLLDRFRSHYIPDPNVGEMEDLDVAAERKRVQMAVANSEQTVRLPTIGNINAGFVDSEVKNNSITRIVAPASDVMQCVNLTKVYPTFTGKRVAVRALTLGIPPGQCTALLGQNGAGKSTTFSMLTGEVRPTAGQIYLNEQLVDSSQLCTGLISYCPQSDAIDPLLTVRETLQLYCRLRGITEQNEVIKRTLDMFELSKYRDSRAGVLSGGNKRKLCAAIAFMGRTPLVLLDEPTSGMDPYCRRSLWAAAHSSARGVLLSTHALADARRLARRVALLRAGELVALASLDDCLHRFGGGYVASCRVRGGGGAAAAGGLLRRAPHARLRLLRRTLLHFHIPTHATVDKKEITTSLSDIFKLMAELQSSCDIEDYTINQSSLDQMFLSFSDNDSDSFEPEDTIIETLPTLTESGASNTDLSSVTSL